jgi:hypothetical protein
MKSQTRHKLKMLALQNKQPLLPNEGKWKMTFVLGGVTYTKTHQFNPQEIKHMKDLCIEFGEEAAGQVIWLQAIAGVKLGANSLIAEAARSFIEANTDHEVGIPPEQSKIDYEALVKRELKEQTEAYVAANNVLSDEEAFKPVGE